MREPPGTVGSTHRLPRRRLLEIGAAALLAAGGAAATVRLRGYAVEPGRRLATMSTWQFVVAQQVARRIVAPDCAEDPTSPSVPSADEVDVAAFMDTFVAQMPSKLRRDLGRFLAYVEHIAPLRLGFGARFTGLPAGAQDRVLAAIERSSSDLLRAGFDGLKSLCFVGYYRDPRTWPIVGYDGPLRGRPASGWPRLDR